MRILCSVIASVTLAIALLWGGGRADSAAAPRHVIVPAVWAAERSPLGDTTLKRGEVEHTASTPLLAMTEADEREEERSAEDQRGHDEADVSSSPLPSADPLVLPWSSALLHFERTVFTAPHPVHLDPTCPPPRA